LVNSAGIQLKPLDFCINGVEFFIVLSIVDEVCCDAPVFKFACTFDHVQELGVWPYEYPPEPPGYWSHQGVIRDAGRHIDGDDMQCIPWTVVSCET
jgi:hypothetical protein